MKKIVLVFMLLISGCVKTTPLDEQAATNPDLVDVSVKNEQKQEEVSTKSDDEKEAELPQPAIDALTLIKRSIYSLSRAELQLNSYMIPLDIVNETQINDFLVLIEKSVLDSNENELVDETQLAEQPHLKFAFDDKENHRILIAYYYGFDIPILQIYYRDTINIQLSSDTIASVETIFHLDKFYERIKGEETMKAFDQQLIQTNNQMALYGEYDNYFDVQLPMNVFRKGHFDNYSGSDLTPFRRVINAYFYTGEFKQGEILNKDIFVYIMRTYPILESLTGGYEFVDEIEIEVNGEPITLSLPESVPGYTTFMPGDEFRNHYYELFDHQVPYDESQSWIESSLGTYIGYLKDADMYLFFRYYGGAIAGYSGWNLMINEQQLEGDILTLDVIKFYSSDAIFFQENTNYNYPMIYKASWQPLTREESNYTPGVSVKDLIRSNLDEFERLKFTIKKRSDTSYALLSVERVNEEVLPGQLLGTELYTVKRKRENQSLVDNHASDAVIVFNVSGRNILSLNHSLYSYSQCSDFDGFKIIEDDNTITIELWCKIKLESENDQWLVYRSRIAAIDKTTFETTISKSYQ